MGIIKSNIFLNNIITSKLLTYLDISDTFILRSDHYHLLNEVLPSETIFGEVILGKILQFLQDMILSDTMDQ